MPPDYKLALVWSVKVARQGEPKARYLLGSMYRDGKGVPKDLARALVLFRQAADQNLHWAQYTLGLMYLLGEGVPADRLEAYQLVHARVRLSATTTMHKCVRPPASCLRKFPPS